MSARVFKGIITTIYYMFCARTSRFPWLKVVPGDGDTGAKDPPHVLVRAPAKSVIFLSAKDLANAALEACTDDGRSPTGVTRTRTLLSHLGVIMISYIL